LRAAAQAGIQRVLLPEGNRSQATGVDEREGLGLHLIFVSRTAEIRQQLAAVTVEAQPSFAGQVRFARSQVRLEKVRIKEDAKEQYHRFWLEDLSGRAFLDVYRNGTVTVQTGPDSSAREAARRAKARI